MLGALPLLRSSRSEWLAGGWDPGIYLNEAAAVAQSGGWQGRTDSVYAALAPEEREVFSRGPGAYREILPSVPLRRDNGALPLYSFPLTPVCGAWLLRLGGMELLLRLPAILAWWSLPVLWALLGLVGWAGWRRWPAMVFWLVSPLWWYHQAIPTAEMLYLLLLLGGLLFYLRSALDRVRLPLGAAACLFAATVNHPNLVVLATGFLLVAAAVEGQQAAAGRWPRILLGFTALAAGLAWCVGFSGRTLLRLEARDHAASLITAIWGLGLLGACGLLARPLPAGIVTRTVRILRLAGMAAGVFLAVLAMAAVFEPWREWLIDAIERLPVAGLAIGRGLRTLPFLGALVVAWAGVGLAQFAARRESGRGLIQLLVLALGGASAFLVCAPGIAAIYPWALRRYLPFLVPFLAFVQAAAVVGWIEGFRLRPRTWNVLALGLLLAALAQGAWLSRAAARVGDYPGLARILVQLADAVDSRDIVVADDPRWGTPLLRLLGRDVINGRLLWDSPDPAFQQNYLEILQRLRAATGRRVLWLTSTDDRLALYPVTLGLVASAPRLEVSYAYHTVIHSTRGDAYAVKPRSQVFRLYEWDGTYARLPDDQGEVNP
jgi:hypothetical protein